MRRLQLRLHLCPLFNLKLAVNLAKLHRHHPHRAAVVVAAVDAVENAVSVNYLGWHNAELQWAVNEINEWNENCFIVIRQISISINQNY